MRCACGALRNHRERLRARRQEKAEEEKKNKKEKEEEEAKKKGPDPASKRLDREPKRNKLLHELVAGVVPSVSSFLRFFL